jgi:hypothetical protein
MSVVLRILLYQYFILTLSSICVFWQNGEQNFLRGVDNVVASFPPVWSAAVVVTYNKIAGVISTTTRDTSDPRLCF